MDDFSALMHKQHGCLHRSQAVSAGWTDRRIRSQLAAGALLLEHGHVLRSPHTAYDETARAWAACLRVRPPVAVATRSAARLLRFPHVSAPSQIQLIVPAHRMIASRPGIHIRRVHDWQRRGFVRVDGLLVSDVADTVLDLGAVLSAARHLRLVQDLLAAGRLHIDVVNARFQHGRKGCARTRESLAVLSDRARSMFERRVAGWMMLRGLPRPSINLPVFDVNDMLLFELDLAWMWLLFVVELDGWGYHSSRVQFQRDRKRQNAVVRRLGATVMRYTFDDHRDRPEDMLDEIAEMLHRQAEKLGRPLFPPPSYRPQKLIVPRS